VILLLDKKEGEKNIKNIMNWKLRRYNIEIMETGLDIGDLDLLIDLYLKNEFRINKKEG
jgi:hypothetical protein